MIKHVSRLVWIAGGFICVGLGVLGLFVPMMPGIVFLLIAAWCFSKSSERYHTWLIEHPQLGPPINRWNKNRAISRSNKAVISAMLFSSVAAAWWLGVSLPLIAVQTVGIVCVLVFIWGTSDE